MQTTTLFMSNLNIYDYVPWAVYKWIHNIMLICEHNGINEREIRVNDQDDHDQVAFIKNH